MPETFGRSALWHSPAELGQRVWESDTFLNTIGPSLARINWTHVSTTEAGGLALIGGRQLVVAFKLTE